MKAATPLSATAIALVLALGTCISAVTATVPAYAADKDKDKDKPKQPSVGPKVAKPLVEAQKLMAEKKFPEALKKLEEAQQVTGKTPYEEYATDDMLGIVYVNLQDYANAAAAFEAGYASGAMPEDLIAPRLKAITQLYYQAKNYAKATEAGNRYLKQVGADAEIAMLVGQGYYIQKDFKRASESFHAALKQAADKQEVPKEDWLQLAMSADYEQGNSAAVQSTLETLVANYPQPKYWQDLLTMMEKNLRGSTKTSLDIYRLMLATGVMKEANEYTEMANVSLQQGLPGEAKRVLEKGMEAGALGAGPQKDRDRALLATATQQAATDQKQLDAGAAEAKAQKTGDADVKFGEAYWSYGQYDKAIELIQRGIAKGVKDKNDAQLRLGIAYLNAGKLSEAQEAFKAITPNTPSAQIARLWVLQGGKR
jgi:tetratricopeptide (TPR) repeat protein